MPSTGQRIDYGERGAMKIVLSNRGLGINVKKCQYDEEIIVLTALCGEET